MPPKSAVERSKYRKEIETLILEGKSSRYISDWLKEQEEPEKISHTAINNYRKNKFNVKETAVRRYREKKSKERLDRAVNEKVAEIEFCDDLIETAKQVGLHVDEEKGITELDIKKLGLQAVKVKHDITKDETPEPINLNLNIDTKRERLKRIGSKHDYRRDARDSD